LKKKLCFSFFLLCTLNCPITKLVPTGDNLDGSRPLNSYYHGFPASKHRPLISVEDKFVLVKCYFHTTRLAPFSLFWRSLQFARGDQKLRKKKNEKRNEKKTKLEFFLFTTSFETDPKLPNVIQLSLVENRYLVVQLNILSVVKLILP